MKTFLIYYRYNQLTGHRILLSLHVLPLEFQSSPWPRMHGSFPEWAVGKWYFVPLLLDSRGGWLTHPSSGSPSEAPSKSPQAGNEDKCISITGKTTAVDTMEIRGYFKLEIFLIFVGCETCISFARKLRNNDNKETLQLLQGGSQNCVSTQCMISR